jgi:hypothetical protein
MVIVRLNLEKKEYLIRFQIIYNSIKNEEHTVEVNTINKFENHLLSISAERQKMFHPKSHPTYNERHQKIIEMINIKMTNQEIEEEEVIIIDNIMKELDKQRKIAITKKQKATLKDEVLEYGEEEDTIDYVLFRICESTGKLY